MTMTKILKIQMSQKVKMNAIAANQISELLQLLGRITPPPPPMKSWYPPTPNNLLLPHPRPPQSVISFTPLYPYHQLFPHHLLYPLINPIRLQQRYQLAWITMCMKAGPLDTCTAWTSFQLCCNTLIIHKNTQLDLIIFPQRK